MVLVFTNICCPTCVVISPLALMCPLEVILVFVKLVILADGADKNTSVTNV